MKLTDFFFQAENFTNYIRRRYKQSNINGNANSFRAKYGESWLDVDFDWIPDINPTEEFLPTDSVLELPPEVVNPLSKQKNYPKVSVKLLNQLKVRKAWTRMGKRGKNKRIAKAQKLCTKPVIRAAARQELVEENGTIAGEVYDELFADRDMGKKIRKLMKVEPELTTRNPVESLAYYLDKDMSRQDWRDFGAFTQGNYPSYEKLKEEMDDILPPNIKIGDFEAKVPMKDLLEKSVTRYFKDKGNYEMLQRKKKEKQEAATDEAGKVLNLKVSFKWGLDGTSPGNQYHQEGEEDKNNIVATQMVILQLEDADTGEIYWRNPLANSCSSCR